MSSCPACNKVVDPLRSRFVGVVDGKIVGFCSPECAAKGAPVSTSHLSGKIAAVAGAASAASEALLAKVPTSPVTPASGVPVMLGEPPRPSASLKVPANLESGPVIEVVRDPGSAGVERAKHPDEISMAKFWSADKEKSGAVAMPAPGPGKDGKPGSGLNKLPSKDAGGKTGSKTGANDAVKDSAKDSAKDAAKSGAKDAAKAGAKDAADVPKDAATPSANGAAKAASADAAASATDLEPARKSRMPLVLLVLVILGVAGFALYRMLAKGNASAATPSSMLAPPAAQVAAVEGQGRRPFDRSPGEPTGGDQIRAEPPRPASPEPAPVDAVAAAAQARAVLVRGLASPSPRIQHLAAAALARTQDAAARASLVAQLGREPSEIAKLDLAYALARSGDKSGVELVAAGLRSSRGEIRDEAARLLALLGDARAVPHLLDLLAVAQRHLGGAEQLARLGEPHGLAALQQLRGDPRASADDKARATIALGLAGTVDPTAPPFGGADARGQAPDVDADALRALLADPHQNMFAAAALAERHDPAAAPVLIAQLASPALRVRAARALRRLDATPGATTAASAQLPALVAALGQGSDPYQLSAAEAILLVTGPAAWAEKE